MNPDQDNPPTIHMPPQQSGGVTADAGGFPVSGFAPPADAPSTPPPASASWLPPTVPVHPTEQGTDTSGQNHQTLVSAPTVADDGDVIEKEWVMRAKQIVDKTRQDPYNQTKELHKFKAEYMQKRYNKTIKAVEE